MIPGGEQPILVTMGVSHYCEKARWALERYGVQFSEEAHIPGAHRPAARAAGGRGSVPCLRLPPPTGSSDASGPPTQRCIDESTPILHWVDSQRMAAAAEATSMEQQQQQRAPLPLFPPGVRGTEVERLVSDFDMSLGPKVRLWAYSHLLYMPQTLEAMTPPSVPMWERVVLRCGGWLVLRSMMAKRLRISQENGDKALQQIKKTFGDVATVLADGRHYLTGDNFTAADLTFAALAEPAVGKAYASAPGLGDNTPPAMRQQVDQLRAHPAGQFVLRLWETQRGVVLR